MSEELASRVMDEQVFEEDESSALPPVSPSSDDFTMRRVTLEVKRNSCPCIKGHREPLEMRGSRTQTLKTTTPKDVTPIISHIELAVSPGSSFAGSGDDEVLTASRKTSISEVVTSRPSSFLEPIGGDPPDYEQATSGDFSVTRDLTLFSYRLGHEHPPSDSIHKNVSDLEIKLPLPSSGASGRPSSLSGCGSGGSVAKMRYSLTGNGRWQNSSDSRRQSSGSSAQMSSSSRRDSSCTTAAADGDAAQMAGTSSLSTAKGEPCGESRTSSARLRYCSKHDNCSSSTDCEESAPLLASVVNYTVINEVHKVPEKETPV